MKNFILLAPCALLFTSCSSYMTTTKETAPNHAMVKRQDVSRVVASGSTEAPLTAKAMATSEEIKKFLELNTCSIKALNLKTDKMIYERNLNQEIEEGDKKSSYGFRTKTQIDRATDANGDKFASIFVPYPTKDLWGGEEIFITFAFDRREETSDESIEHNLFVNTTSSSFEQNPIAWKKQPTLTGIDFVFKLKNAQRQYILRCDPNH
ncbi:MAG: hypothetical protein ACXVLQ_04870 [Bacteriovorax sp.]